MTKHNAYDLLYELQSGKCNICKEELTDRFHTQIDHIERQEQKGSDEIENLRLICLPCDWEREGNAPNSVYPNLKTAYKGYKFWQTEKDRVVNMRSAFQGDTKGTTRSPYFNVDMETYLVNAKEGAEEKEKLYLKEIRTQLKEIPAYEILKDAWGAGDLVLAHIISCFDIRKGETVSSMWKFFGYTPQDSAGAKGRNPGRGKLRAPLYAALSISLIRKTSPYREFYDKTKKKLQDNGREKGAHSASLQRTIKLWLSHLWATWRELEGLAVTKPYAHSQLNHDGFISPESCGWISQKR